MLCLKTRPFSLTLSSSTHQFHRLPSSKPFSHSIKMSSHSQTIEHIVLFKVKDNTDPTNLNSMLTGLSSLLSLSHVRHLTVGPILRNPSSSSLNFTHMLHSRYDSKDHLAAYSAHPDHLNVVKGSVLPICDDIMAVDWVAHNLDGDLVPPPGSAIRVSFLKLKEGLGDGVKDEVLGVVGGIKDKFGGIRQLSYGDNFSPARAKGFSIASLAVFPGKDELDALDSNGDLVTHEKDKVREYLDTVLVLDYLVPSPQARPANL